VCLQMWSNSKRHGLIIICKLVRVGVLQVEIKRVQYWEVGSTDKVGLIETGSEVKSIDGSRIES